MSFPTHGGATYSQICTMINIKKAFQTEDSVIILLHFLYNNCHKNEWDGAPPPPPSLLPATVVITESLKFVDRVLSPPPHTHTCPRAPSPLSEFKKGTPLNPFEASRTIKEKEKNQFLVILSGEDPPPPVVPASKRLRASETHQETPETRRFFFAARIH